MPFRLLLSSFMLAVGLSFGASGHAAEPAEQVGAALKAMDRYVGEGDNGVRWNAYLLTDALRAQLAAGEEADPAVVAEVIAKYRSDAPGLNEARFQAVLAALEAWHELLIMPSQEELAEFARGHADQFRGKTAEDVAVAKQQLQAALGRLARFVGSGANGDKWRDYLGTAAAESQLAADEPDMKPLEHTVQQLSANKAGLELLQFTQLRDALRAYIDTYQIANNPKVKEAYEAQIAVLADSLSRYAADPSHETAQQIAGRIGWFERMDQAPVLVKSVRQFHSHPNFMGYASEGLLKAAMERPIDSTTNITDNFQGTRLVGTGYTTGGTKIELVPHDSKIAFDILFYGNTVSKTRGYNGPVTVSTTGNTAMSARKRILIDKHGLADLPATAAAVTSTRTDGVNSGGGLFNNAIQREAWSRINGSRSAAERHGSERAKRQIRQTVDRQAREFLTKANAGFEEKFKAPLVRQQAFPRVLEMSTDGDYLNVLALQANNFQIAAPGPAPEFGDQGDLGFRMHASLVNNAAAVFYSGRTITQAESNEFMLKVFGEIPEELKAPEDAEPWSITFARQNPILVSFDEGNRVSFTLSGRKYTSGDRSFGAMDVKATYELIVQGDMLLLRRDGELRIEPPGFDPDKTRLSSSQVTLRTLLKKRFVKVLKPEIEAPPFLLPGEFAKAGKVGFDAAETNGGWLVMRMNRVAETADTPASESAEASAAR